MPLGLFSSVVDIRERVAPLRRILSCLSVLLFERITFTQTQVQEEKYSLCALLSQELPWSCGEGSDASTRAFVARALLTESLGLITQQPGRAPQPLTAKQAVEE
jgi:hypothetical protein